MSILDWIKQKGEEYLGIGKPGLGKFGDVLKSAATGKKTTNINTVMSLIQTGGNIPSLIAKKEGENIGKYITKKIFNLPKTEEEIVAGEYKKPISLQLATDIVRAVPRAAMSVVLEPVAEITRT